MTNYATIPFAPCLTLGLIDLNVKAIVLKASKPLSLAERLTRDLANGTIHAFLDQDSRHARLRQNIKRDMPSFAELRGKHMGHVACVVGSGPTLQSKLPELVALHKAGAVIFAVNTAHDFLWKCNQLSRLRPRVHYGVLCDSNDWVATYMRPHKKTDYLLASQCHDKTFDRFKNASAYLWHAIQSGDAEVLKERTGAKAYIDYGVRLGTTVGLRALQLAMGTGADEIHMIGFDSCAAVDNAEDPKSADLHATNKDPKRVDSRYKRNEYFCPLRNKKFVWYANDAMAVQAMEFEQIIYQLGEMIARGQIPECRIMVHGDDEFLPFLAANHDLHAAPEKNKSVIAWEIHNNPTRYEQSQVDVARMHLKAKGIIREAA